MWKARREEDKMQEQESEKEREGGRESLLSRQQQPLTISLHTLFNYQLPPLFVCLLPFSPPYLPIPFPLTTCLSSTSSLPSPFLFYSYHTLPSSGILPSSSLSYPFSFFLFVFAIFILFYTPSPLFLLSPLPTPTFSLSSQFSISSSLS